ncbi:MAG: hypothetical protein CM1200mP35_00090 [Chloroflexota bacterium]|nr:MAG: hypothetical protein CM1200mP35_00090 [Chloroflexota bacterium]
MDMTICFWVRARDLRADYFGSFGTYNLEGDETLPEAIIRSKEEVESSALTDFAFHLYFKIDPVF